MSRLPCKGSDVFPDNHEHHDNRENVDIHTMSTPVPLQLFSEVHFEKTFRRKRRPNYNTGTPLELLPSVSFPHLLIKSRPVNLYELSIGKEC